MLAILTREPTNLSVSRPSPKRRRRATLAAGSVSVHRLIPRREAVNACLIPADGSRGPYDRWPVRLYAGETQARPVVILSALQRR